VNLIGISGTGIAQDGLDTRKSASVVSGELWAALLCRSRRFRRLKRGAADEVGERVTDMLTADKLMVALIVGRRRAVPDPVPDRVHGEADATIARARSRERILLVHRTLARRRQRVIAARLLP
jgi:hypothetical protein